MSRDKYTHASVLFFEVSVRAAEVMVAERRRDDPEMLQTVARSLRTMVSVFDHEDAWEGSALRVQALVAAQGAESLATSTSDLQPPNQRAIFEAHEAMENAYKRACAAQHDLMASI